MASGYSNFFQEVTGHEPFPYQARFGSQEWPELLDVPTGLGKTSAVVVAWLWKRLNEDPDTPRRLVYCLPMRVLVEQTVSNARRWIQRCRDDFLGRGVTPPEVYTLMGGSLEEDWEARPEAPAVLVGTQDMLLSRALMRGYGMSRYKWPVHFALLHNDALWVFDEIQLMGAGLTTSAQLDAFRRSFPSGVPARSLWASATLRREWLDTVDFSPHLGSLRTLGVDEDDRERARSRLEATKKVARASVEVGEGTPAQRGKEYIDRLVDAVLASHEPGSQTLVILNRVERAQALASGLRKRETTPPTLLLHARFRPRERRAIEAQIQDDVGETGRILVATQAVEAGVDLTSSTLFTELAPWPSMVQRFGRCNRYGECADGADVCWIDPVELLDEAEPYEAQELGRSRRRLEGLTDVGPSRLPRSDPSRSLSHVLRRKDLLELFDTDPDLSGFDVDVAPYIRDQGSPQVQVFWRDFENGPGEAPPPQREELCPVSMGQMAAYRKKRGGGRYRSFWRWDPLVERWEEGNPGTRIVPGWTLLLRATDGGYDPTLGFDAQHTREVEPVDLEASEEPHERYGGEDRTQLGRFIALEAHTLRAVECVRDLGRALELPEEECRLMEVAALWHDVGKAHPAFQTALLDAAADPEAMGGSLWAKSPGTGRLRYRILEGEEERSRPHFRHELASMLAWLEHGNEDPGRDLVAYLIAAHHGKVRTGIRALPTESLPEDDRLHARGVWEDDVLPEVQLNGTSIPETSLRLEVMRLGMGPMGPSWTDRTRRLLQTDGPFRLAWLESLVRIADWRASAAEEAE